MGDFGDRMLYPSWSLRLKFPLKVDGVKRGRLDSAALVALPNGKKRVSVSGGRKCRLDLH